MGRSATSTVATDVSIPVMLPPGLQSPAIALLVLGALTVARSHVWAEVDERPHYDYIQKLVEDFAQRQRVADRAGRGGAAERHDERLAVRLAKFDGACVHSGMDLGIVDHSAEPDVRAEQRVEEQVADS